MAEHSAAAAAAAAATTSSAAYQRGAPLPPGVGEGLIDSLSDEEEEEAEAQEEEEEAPAAEEEEEAEAEAEVEEGEGGEGQSLADESMQSAAAAPVKAGAAPGKKTSRASVKGPKVRGTTTLPISRVQRIIKADRDVDICSKESTFLISVATELFIKRFVDEGYTNARLDKRKVVNYKDMAKAAQQQWYLHFLKETVPTAIPLSAALAARQSKMDANYFLDSGLVEDAAAAGLDVSGLSSGLGGSAGELSNGHGNGNSHDDAPGNGNGNLTGPGTSNSGGVQTHAALGPGGKKISKKGKNKSAAEKASKRASGLESGAEAGGSGAAGADATAEDSEADMSGYASAAGGMERSFGRAGLAANGHAKDVDMMDS